MKRDFSLERNGKVSIVFYNYFLNIKESLINKNIRNSRIPLLKTYSYSYAKNFKKLCDEEKPFNLDYKCILTLKQKAVIVTGGDKMYKKGEQKM